MHWLTVLSGVYSADPLTEWLGINWLTVFRLDDLTPQLTDCLSLLCGNLMHWLSDVEWTSWLSKDLLTITGDWMMWNCLVDCFRAYLSSFIVPLTLLFGGWLADCLTLWLDEWLTRLTGWLNDVELICRLFEGLLKLTHCLTEGLTGWLYCRGLTEFRTVFGIKGLFFDSINDSWADPRLWV